MSFCDSYEYKILVIDSKYATYNSNKEDFYINLDEPLRDVYKIEIIACLINIPSSSGLSLLDSVYIDLNGYKRLISKNNKNNLHYFDSLIIDKPLTVSGTVIQNDYNNNQKEYILNPVQPQISRFNIRLFNVNEFNDVQSTNDVLLNKGSINRFIIKLIVYFTNKKQTRV